VRIPTYMQDFGVGTGLLGTLGGKLPLSPHKLCRAIAMCVSEHTSRSRCRGDLGALITALLAGP